MVNRILNKVMMRYLFICALFLSAFRLAAQEGTFDGETKEQRDKRMAWWREARFGMFIHYGVFAQFGGVWNGIPQKTKHVEWMMNREKIPVADYKAQARNFNPTKFDAEQWVKMAKDAGMKYLVFTAKHHDGFAMFNTKVSDWSIVNATVYGKDLLKPLAEACRKYGLKLGIYYSHSQDWGNPGGGVNRSPMKQGQPRPDSAKIDAYTLAHNGHWDPMQDTKTFDEYLRTVALPQVKELLTNYGDVAVLWWDTPALNKEQAQLFKDALKPYPNIITNNRLASIPAYRGDFKTPEQRIPNLAELDGKDWETCMTMNDTWGYRPSDHDWKSDTVLLQKLIDIASKGGNYLLNIGPRPDGTFPPESVQRLNTISNWMEKYSEAIYGTSANPLADINWGRITTKNSNGKSTLYLSVFEWPKNGKLMLDGLNANVKSIRLLDTKLKLKWQQTKSALIIDGLPLAPTDNIASVLEINLDKVIHKKDFRPTKKMIDGSVN